jgi:hypothetical protein
MFKKNKNIFKYVPTTDGTQDLVPAKNHIPQWFKDIKPYGPSNLQWDQTGRIKKNVKSCIPFLDTFTCGYTVELWCDVYIDIASKERSIRWGAGAGVVQIPPVHVRDAKDHMVPTPQGYDDISHYVWILPYAFKTPPGYSSFISHPLNRYDLPFISLSGIVDTDKIMHGGNVPFFLRKDFSGVIKRGTPILQILPFKRENWTSEKDLLLKSEDQEERARANNVLFGHYKDNKWSKKKYE